jgi:hypothetical protein
MYSQLAAGLPTALAVLQIQRGTRFFRTTNKIHHRRHSASR